MAMLLIDVVKYVTKGHQLTFLCVVILKWVHVANTSCHIDHICEISDSNDSYL